MEVMIDIKVIDNKIIILLKIEWSFYEQNSFNDDINKLNLPIILTTFLFSF